MYVCVYLHGKTALLLGQKSPITRTKEPYYSDKRALLLRQKSPITQTKEPYYSDQKELRPVTNTLLSAFTGPRTASFTGPRTASYIPTTPSDKHLTFSLWFFLFVANEPYHTDTRALRPITQTKRHYAWRQTICLQEFTNKSLSLFLSLSLSLRSAASISRKRGPCSRIYIYIYIFIYYPTTVRAQHLTGCQTQKRPTKETYKRDPQTMKETCRFHLSKKSSLFVRNISLSQVRGGIRRPRPGHAHHIRVKRAYV